MTTKNANDKLYDRVCAAAYIGYKPGTLEVWASTKYNDIPYRIIKKKAYYKESDLDNFLESTLIRLIKSR